MFGKGESRQRKAERIAGQALDQLNSAVSTAETSARSARRRVEKVYGDTSYRMGAGAKEARLRASDAYDALMGRRRRSRSWGWLLTVAAVGIAAGWAATTVGQRAMRRDEPLALPDSLADEYVEARP